MIMKYFKGAVIPLGPKASGKSNALKEVHFILDMIKGEGTGFSKNIVVLVSDNPITTVE